MVVAIDARPSGVKFLADGLVPLEAQPVRRPAARTTARGERRAIVAAGRWVVWVWFMVRSSGVGWNGAVWVGHATMGPLPQTSGRAENPSTQTNWGTLRGVGL